MGPLSTEDAPRDAIDRMLMEDMIDVLLGAHEQGLAAARHSRQEILRAVERAVERLRTPASRLIYCGAGTSGRIGLLDGVELRPTFGWPSDRLHVLMAGGADSSTEAVEGAEDDRDAGRMGIEEANVGPDDVVLGLAASGTTPFTIAALETARARGALTIGACNNADAPLMDACEVAVHLDTGGEVLAGSTRLAAGTSQKAFLNTFSTAVMVRLGHVHDGLMVDMEVTNRKLRDRAVRIVAQIAGVHRDEADRALVAASFKIKPAVLIALGSTPNEAEQRLRRSAGILGRALQTSGT